MNIKKFFDTIRVLDNQQDRPIVMSTQTESLELIRIKLNNETAKASWKELEVFFARGQILCVNPEQDLIEVAARLSLDHTSVLKDWLRNNTVFQPQLDWVKENCKPNTSFWTVVVAPFVIIQRV